MSQNGYDVTVQLAEIYTSKKEYEKVERREKKVKCVWGSLLKVAQNSIKKYF